MLSTATGAAATATSQLDDLGTSRVTTSTSTSTSYGTLFPEIFADLDQLMKLDPFKTISLQATQLVVIGDEKSGKTLI